MHQEGQTHAKSLIYLLHIENTAQKSSKVLNTFTERIKHIIVHFFLFALGSLSSHCTSDLEKVFAEVQEMFGSSDSDVLCFARSMWMLLYSNHPHVFSINHVVSESKDVDVWLTFNQPHIDSQYSC